MFCNACGTELQASFNVCPKCGKPVGDPISSVTRSRLRNFPDSFAGPVFCQHCRSFRDSRQHRRPDARSTRPDPARRHLSSGGCGRHSGGCWSAQSSILGARRCDRAGDHCTGPFPLRHGPGYLYPVGPGGRRWRRRIPPRGGCHLGRSAHQGFAPPGISAHASSRNRRFFVWVAAHETRAERRLFRAAGVGVRRSHPPGRRRRRN